MKISVIIAVVHMTLGIFVKASNSLFHKKYLDFFLEFIPQLIFMLALFGYMDFLIIYKWLQYWPDIDTAPSIITTMINFPLKLGKTVNIHFIVGRLLWRRAYVGNIWKYFTRYNSACLADFGPAQRSYNATAKTTLSDILRKEIRIDLIGLA